uniref:Uncharacterized protein n=1 Tax=Anopheles atroparvus TaxID=41427 RepID=A0A182IJU7_ANOAO
MACDSDGARWLMVKSAPVPGAHQSIGRLLEKAENQKSSIVILLGRLCSDGTVVVVVAGNRDAVTLGGLTPDTQYQLSVAAVWNGKRYRSRPIVFRTLEPPRTSYQLDSGSPAGSSGPPNSPHADTAPSLSGIGIFNDEFGNMSVNSTSRELPTFVAPVCLTCFSPPFLRGIFYIHHRINS